MVGYIFFINIHIEIRSKLYLLGFIEGGIEVHLDIVYFGIVTKVFSTRVIYWVMVN